MKRHVLAALAACVFGEMIVGCSGRGSSATGSLDAGAIEECDAYLEALSKCVANGGAAGVSATEAARTRLTALAKDDSAHDRLRAKCLAGQKTLASSCR